MKKLSETIKPGQLIATTNVKGYEGMELALYLGRVSWGLELVQWIGKKGDPCQIFTEDLDKTFYKTKIIRVDNDEIEFKRKYERNSDGN